MKDLKNVFGGPHNLKRSANVSLFQRNLEVVDSVANFVEPLDRQHFVHGDPKSIFFKISNPKEFQLLICRWS